MQTNTLRGVFPGPKPVHRKNFIRENMRHIKRMQGLSPTPGKVDSLELTTGPATTGPMKSISNAPATRSRNKLGELSIPLSKSHKNLKQPSNREKKRPESSQDSGQVSRRLATTAVQTEQTEDIIKLYSIGIIKYPSSSVLKELAAKRSPKRRHRSPLDHGDSIVVSNPHNEELGDEIGGLSLRQHDYVRENATVAKERPAKAESARDPTKAPPTYQRGVLPKYMRDRKEEAVGGEVDPECPEGHVLLPEEERRETLRVLRQSYADRIQELNSMPVRSDTLRMRKRKMEIEQELKKIDEGIKVFQRPKVFVKINA